MKTDIGRVIVFVIYTICYEAIIWGIFGWAVFVKGHSGWWVVVAMICSSGQMKPKHFGISSAGCKDAEKQPEV